MKFLSCLIIYSCLSICLSAQSDNAKSKEGFKESTVSDFLNSKYKWEKPKEKAEAPKVEIVNDTPLKTVDQRIAERNAIIQAHLQPTLPIDNPNEAIPDDELGLDTVELREFKVSELYSPLMRMSELKDLDTLNPASGGAFLSEQYFSDLENKYLNRFTIPLIGKSQEQLAKERYQREQYQSFLGEVSGTIDDLNNLNPEYAKELKKEFRDAQQQYNNNFKIDDNRFNNPEAKF